MGLGVIECSVWNTFAIQLGFRKPKCKLMTYLILPAYLILLHSRDTISFIARGSNSIHDVPPLVSYR